LISLFQLEAAQDALPLELENPDPVDLRIAGLVVLLDASVDAATAADAAGDVEAIAEQHVVDGSGRGHGELLAVLRLVLPLQPLRDRFDLVVGHPPELLLEEGFQVEGLGRSRHPCRCACRGPRCGGGIAQELPA
jgi:hypothetical protein